ncbi:phospholipase effector Tle1 domain-containing protein [Ectopseudomonas chengduensis]|jgi:hypothetical protein|nr:DUF2235 domain-containing protein [Pseudomonas sp. 905_Psudmo1]WFS19641.1 DUF2235 domain-containing protein [Pseudomonas sp. 905_Psudmo1]
MSNSIAEQAAAMSARCNPAQHSSHIAPCEHTLRIGFFFDGFGRHRIKDMQTGRVSNIAKLFLVHKFDQPNQPQDPLFSYRKFYASGLGEDFSADLDLIANSGLTSFESTASDIPAGVVEDQAIEAAKDVLDAKRNWWERISRDLKALLQKPVKAGKLLKGALIDASVELWAPLRDNPYAAELLKTGADTRIQGAMDFLAGEIREIEIQTDRPLLKKIELTVYGFDYGATLARAFLHELLSREPQPSDGTYRYQGKTLTLLFAGLFDGVDRSHVDLPYLPLPVRTVLDDGGPLPEHVKQALHLVAANERRFYRRARLLGSSKANWREKWMPGVSEDIGGSLLAGEQKPSAELALVSLHEMYHAARRAGAPFPALDELPTIDRKLASLFIFNDHFEQASAKGLSRHYKREAQTSIAELKGVKPFYASAPMRPQELLFAAHMRLYIRWLGALWRPYQERLRQLAEEEERLRLSALGSMSGMLGISRETAAQRDERTRRLQAITDERTTLRANFGWLEEVDEEANDMRLALNNPKLGWRAAGTREQADIWLVLLSEWFDKNPREVSEPMHRFFGHFVHDRLVFSVAQRSAQQFQGQSFFALRGFDVAS